MAQARIGHWVGDYFKVGFATTGGAFDRLPKRRSVIVLTSLQARSAFTLVVRNYFDCILMGI